MKLDQVHIQNFGKIKDAQLNFRPLTVITGRNSTGKSFVTRGLYSILHTLDDDLIVIYLRKNLDEISWNFKNIHLVLEFINKKENIGLITPLLEGIREIQQILKNLIENITNNNQDNIPLVRACLRLIFEV